ncbi:MAG: protein kinase [Acidobacteriota bacterium]
MIGATLSHYRILSRLGEGGMGVVYRARDERLDRDVAIKVLPAEVAGDSERLARFEREAKAVAALSHASILEIFDFDSEDGINFAVTELLEGDTLHERLRNAAGPLPLSEVLEIGAAVASGLAAAHGRGVLHRDIKPSNIFLCSDGRVKILDFGLAKVDEGPVEDLETMTSPPPATEAGVMLGTVGYMSPEQVRGEELDGGSDIFSLGVVLYEMATGRRPFEGPTTGVVLESILNRPPPAAASVNPELPAEFEDIINQSLEKRRSLRYPTATELLADLQAVKPGPTPRTRPLIPSVEGAETKAPAAGIDSRSGRRSRPAQLAVAALSVALLALGLWYTLGRENGPAPSGPVEGRNVIAVMPFTVRGSDEVAYLGPGMVDLLSVKLDGAGSFTTVDPHAVMRAAGSDAAVIDPGLAASMSAELGAGLFLLGSIVQAGESLQISTSLYDSDGSIGVVSQGSAEGPAEEVFALVDAVTAQLLVVSSGGPEAQVQRVAGVTTESLPAFKAYLEGEEAYRGGEYGASLDHFERAVAIDPEFALAYYRISTAAEWAWDEKQIYAAAERAVELAHRLPERERRLVEVLGVRRREANESAESVLRSFLGIYPNDLEAWVNLGELVNHTRPMHGRSFLEARQIWERVLSIDEAHTGALLHVMRMDAFEGELESMDAGLGRFHELYPRADRSIEMDILSLATHGDPASEAKARELLATASDVDLLMGVWNAAVYAKNYDLSIELCEMMVGADHSVAVRRTAYSWLASLQYAKGRLGAMRQALDGLAMVDALAAAEYRPMFLGLPFVENPTSELESAFADLERQLMPEPTDRPQLIIAAHDNLHPLLQQYGLGRLAVLSGATEVAREHAETLGGMRLETDHEGLAQDLAIALHGHLALSAAQPEAALERFEAMKMSAWHGQSLFSPFYARTAERFARAEALEMDGRGDEALGWYEHLAENSPFEVAFVPPSLMRRAEIHAERGETERAIDLYEEFIRLWEDCDQELRSIVDAGRSRVAELKSVLPTK